MLFQWNNGFQSDQNRTEAQKRIEHIEYVYRKLAFMFMPLDS